MTEQATDKSVPATLQQPPKTKRTSELTRDKKKEDMRLLFEECRLFSSMQKNAEG